MENPRSPRRSPDSLERQEIIDTEDVAIRLGPALDYVLGIERFLLERQETYPVFTMLEEECDSG